MTRAPSPYFGLPDRPVFVGGPPRSGTTLLRHMLNSHPDLGIPRETRVVLPAFEQRGRWGDLSVEANRRALAEWVATRKEPSASRIAPLAELRRRVMNAPPTLGSAMGNCLAAYAAKKGKVRWGDKRPVYVRYLDAVFALFPDAQVISLIRDPRETVASLRKIGWWDGRIVPSLELWHRSAVALDPWRPLLAPDQLLELKYEEFVAEPEKTLQQISDFLCLDPDGLDAMVNYHENIDETSPVHEHLAEPVRVMPPSWPKTLEPSEIAFVERITASEMTRLGYEPSAHARVSTADLDADYRARVARMGRYRRNERILEFKHLLRYRHPVAAQLTIGQQRALPAQKQPGFLARTAFRPL
jgi:sulfotransferase family protein